IKVDPTECSPSAHYQFCTVLWSRDGGTQSGVAAQDGDHYGFRLSSVSFLI
ncbi:hypothetical protein AVEN_108432-1, partial [Araneus ventricosus]